MDDPILITGCARSGTSLVAGIINICGAFGGVMSKQNRHNRKGMFENAEIRNNVVKPYLRQLGVDPLGQFPLPDVDSLEPFDELKKRCQHVMKWNGYRGGPWFYKGAKMCLIWPLFRDAFPGAKWIIVRRRDEDIVRSCLNTGFMRAYDNAEGWHAWVDHHKARFEEIKRNVEYREVWPFRFVQGDFTEIRLLVQDYLGLEWNEEGVLDFVEPSFYHVHKEDKRHGESDGR